MRAFLPRVLYDRIQVIVRYLWKEFLDGRTYLLRCFPWRGRTKYVGANVIFGEGLSQPALLALLDEIFFFKISAAVISIFERCASFIDDFGSEVISNAVNMVRYFLRIRRVFANRLGLPRDTLAVTRVGQETFNI